MMELSDQTYEQTILSLVAAKCQGAVVQNVFCILLCFFQRFHLSRRVAGRSALPFEFTESRGFYGQMPFPKPTSEETNTSAENPLLFTKEADVGL